MIPQLQQLLVMMAIFSIYASYDAAVWFFCR
jgi:hypothetical protein